MGKDKKQSEEQLQELRTKNHNTLRYQKRQQDDAEAKQRMADYLEWLAKEQDDE